MDTRRRTERATLPTPIPARANGVTADVVDVSTAGVRLAHSALFHERKPLQVSVEWRGQTIRFIAEPRWTNPKRGKYESGFQIHQIDEQSTAALRMMIEAAMRTTARYERHELLHGVWIITRTSDSRQPPAGFTIPESEPTHTIEFFRAAYSRGNRDVRDRIKKLAELSIERPARGYDA
jgi:PilZ domain-containing protein